MIRNPIERAWSHALMNLASDSGRDAGSVGDEEFIRHFRLPRSRKRGDYLSMLKRWEAIYPREQIFVGFFDDVVARPRVLLNDVFRHIGVTANVDWESLGAEQVVNKGAGRPLPPHLRGVLEEIYAAEIERLYERFGERVASWRCCSGAAPSTAAAANRAG
jgi:hypothetical protein